MFAFEYPESDADCVSLLNAIPFRIEYTFPAVNAHSYGYAFPVANTDADTISITDEDSV